MTWTEVVNGFRNCKLIEHSNLYDLERGILVSCEWLS